jgi:glutamate N-acetyltransferase/amino-acid N-acetyltransferase
MTENLTNGVTYPLGFKACGVRAGIKESGDDLALIYSESPAAGAGLFTTNMVKAAPVLLSRSRLPADNLHAIVANSGNANACTGEQGVNDARSMAAYAAELLGVPEESVLAASTGIIGHAMPMKKVLAGIDKAVQSLSAEGGIDAARAVMTTDTYPKTATAEFSIGGSRVRVGGMAKGAGMICPNVATMLSFITTDAAITPRMLLRALTKSADVSYNCLTIDGDTSTNDTVIILANGMAGNAKIDSDGPEFNEFLLALSSVTTSLAKQVAMDGEGATKMVEITVEGTASYEDARQIAKTVANSPLVKTAMFGCDPNWGRVLAAAGRAGVNFDPADVNLYFGEIEMLRGGEPVAFPADKAHELLDKQEVHVLLQVGGGPGRAVVWTSDFSYDYVKINAEYHT